MESIRIFSKVAGSIWIEEANGVEQDGQVKLRISSCCDPTRGFSAFRMSVGQPTDAESAAARPRMAPTGYVGAG
jgi:hypothetical protein